jgi:nodulation protein E
LTRQLRRVVVTGMGAVCATGLDVPHFTAALLAGEVGIGPIVNIPTDRLSNRIAAEVRGLDPAAHFTAKRLPLLDRVAQLGMIAAREAMAQAGLAPGGCPLAAVVLGSGSGQHTLDDAYLRFYGQGAPRVHPFSVPRIMPNGPASHISMEFGIRGPVFAVSSACASANHAIGQAMQMIRWGMVDVAVSGGCDASIVPGFMKGWEALRVLSPDACRPFSLDRTGLVIGEGAGVLVLEALEHALSRGATPLMELAGFGMGADGVDVTAPDAEGAASTMKAALNDAGCSAAQIGYVNAHGTGTRLNDRTETAALRLVFGAGLDAVPVSSTKSMIGHCMTAGGALELIATAMALRDGWLPPTAGFTTADPDCDLDCVPNEARRADVEYAMSNAFAFGGLNAVLIARRWGEA